MDLKRLQELTNKDQLTTEELQEMPALYMELAEEIAVLDEIRSKAGKILASNFEAGTVLLLDKDRKKKLMVKEGRMSYKINPEKLYNKIGLAPFLKVASVTEKAVKTEFGDEAETLIAETKEFVKKSDNIVSLVKATKKDLDA